MGEKRHPISAFVRSRRRMIYGRTNAPPRPSPCRRRETSFRLSRPRWTSRLGFARGGARSDDEEVRRGYQWRNNCSRSDQTKLVGCTFFAD